MYIRICIRLLLGKEVAFLNESTVVGSGKSENQIRILLSVALDRLHSERDFEDLPLLQAGRRQQFGYIISIFLSHTFELVDFSQ